MAVDLSALLFLPRIQFVIVEPDHSLGHSSGINDPQRVRFFPHSSVIEKSVTRVGDSVYMIAVTIIKTDESARSHESSRRAVNRSRVRAFRSGIRRDQAFSSNFRARNDIYGSSIASTVE